MVIAGIDIGFNHTGIVLARPDRSRPTGWDILDNVCIHTVPSKSKKQRKLDQSGVAAKDVFRSILLKKLVSKSLLCYNVDGVVVEVPTGGSKSARAGRCMGMATSIIACVVEEFQSVAREEHRVFLAHYIAPLETKHYAAELLCIGKGAVSKDRVAECVTFCFKDQNVEWPKKKKDREHVIDAAGALLVAAGHPEFYCSLFCGENDD